MTHLRSTADGDVVTDTGAGHHAGAGLHEHPDAMNYVVGDDRTRIYHVGPAQAGDAEAANDVRSMLHRSSLMKRGDELSVGLKLLPAFKRPQEGISTDPGVAFLNII